MERSDLHIKSSLLAVWLETVRDLTGGPVNPTANILRLLCVARAGITTVGCGPELSVGDKSHEQSHSI